MLRRAGGNGETLSIAGGELMPAIHGGRPPINGILRQAIDAGRNPLSGSTFTASSHLEALPRRVARQRRASGAGLRAP